MIKKESGFYSIDLKIGNMRNVQSFTLYPSMEGIYALLQSDKRCIYVNTETGEGKLSKCNTLYPTFAVARASGIDISLSMSICQAIRDHYVSCKVGTNEVKIGNTVLLTY